MVRRVEFSAIVRTIGGVPVLEVGGEIDLATSERFREALGEAVSENGGGLLIVDLTGVRFMGADGGSVLEESTEEFRENGGEIRLAVSSHEVKTVLRLTGAEDRFTLYPDAFSAANEG